jgi:hypothetical protein
MISDTYNNKTYCRGYSPTKSFGKQPCEDAVGNPIQCGSGNKYQHEIDYVSDLQALRFERMYNSTAEGWRQPTYRGPLWFTRIGKHWRHTYDRAVFLVQSNGFTPPSSTDPTEKF